MKKSRSYKTKKYKKIIKFRVTENEEHEFHQQYMYLCF